MSILLLHERAPPGARSDTRRERNGYATERSADRPHARDRVTQGALWPDALGSGARVALIAPAGPLQGEADLARAVANTRDFRWEPVVGAHVLARSAYFAGDDAMRLADLQRAIDDPRIDAIWCVRGGYGAMRLLGALDLSALARRPKPLIGYSDITALHCAIAARCGLVTFHGPTARAALTPFSRESLARALVTRGDPCGIASGARVVRPGAARGRLAGGNLSLLAALAGTRDAPSFDGTIVVLEDIGEAVYRIDRMLQQLRLAGIFRGCRAIAFGVCTACPEHVDDDGARRLDDVLRETADALDVPCLAGIPVGHIDDQWTIPLGADAELDADAAALHVRNLPDTRASHAPSRSTQPTTLPDLATMSHKSYADLVAEAKSRIKEITPADAIAMRQRGEPAVIVDIREPNEWNLGHAPGAVHIPRGILESRIENAAARDQTVVLYCAGGSRSALAADTLRQMGFTDVRSMERGFRGWVEEGGEIDG